MRKASQLPRTFAAKTHKWSLPYDSWSPRFTNITPVIAIGDQSLPLLGSANAFDFFFLAHAPGAESCLQPPAANLPSHCARSFFRLS